MEQRIASIISEYAAQGIHRTGTTVDNESADWLAARVKAMGVAPELDTWQFKRVEVVDARFRMGELDISGVPFYDCNYTDAAGVSGSLGEMGSDADIGVAMTLPYAAGPGYAPVEAARKHGTHKALLLVTDKRMPADGIATINAESFGSPFGPPVLQIANRHWDAIQAAVKRGDKATLVAHCDRVDATAANVQARIAGADASLAPVVVMTPRSGWWRCASERGGGIAAWLEMMRAVKSAGGARDVIFTANSGHELGHTGLDHYLEAHGSLIAGAHMWIHLGANFVARVMPAVRLQYSDKTAEGLVRAELARTALKPARETPPGTRPAGEARNIFDGGGHYISILGGNGLFHHPDDLWPDAVDMKAATAWISAFVDLSVKLAA